MCSDSPDTSGINQAAVASAQLSQDALNWYKGVYADQAPARDAAAAKANAVADAQINAMNYATDQAKDLDAYNKSTFRPLEQSIVNDAATFDTPARRMQAAADAAAGIDQSFAATRAANDRALQRSGVAPGTAKAMAIQQDAATAQGAARAGAMTTAVRNIEAQGHARQMDAASLGRNIASNQATQQQIATTAGTAGTNSSTAALNATTSGNATMGQGFTTAINGQQAAGNLYAQAAKLSESNAGGLMQGVGGIMQGLGSMGYSSKKVKHDKKPASDEAALDAINNLDNGSWTYNEGVEDGGTHVGPYAEDMQREMGDEVAPGGRMVNLTKMMGDKNRGAIRALSKQLAGLEKQIAQVKSARA